MIINFEIPGKLPSLNEFLNETKSHNNRYFGGNQMKRKAETYISMFIPSKTKGLLIDQPCEICFTYYEPNRKRDPDNISAVAHKFILDTLVKTKVIINDSQKYIKKILDIYCIDPKSPRIEVMINC